MLNNNLQPLVDNIISTLFELEKINLTFKEDSSFIRRQLPLILRKDVLSESKLEIIKQIRKTSDSLKEKVRKFLPQTYTNWDNILFSNLDKITATVNSMYANPSIPNNTSPSLNAVLLTKHSAVWTQPSTPISSATSTTPLLQEDKQLNETNKETPSKTSKNLCCCTLM